LLVFSVPILAQELGVSGNLVTVIPKYANEFGYGGSSYYSVNHKNHVCPGIRLEGNYLLKGFNFPYTAFNGIGITYLFPIKDSVCMFLRTNRGSEIIKKGFERNSMLNFDFRFGYEIPQTFNDFLTIEVGWGGGIMTSQSKYLLPAKTTSFNYDEADFIPKTFKPYWDFTLSAEAFAGIVYELEKYSIIAQYSFQYGFIGVRSGNESILDCHIRNTVSIGIFYALKKY
jgi:hypothetical protein